MLYGSAVLLLLLVIAVTSPFPLWRSYFTVLRATVADRSISRSERGRLLRYVLKDLFWLPARGLLFRLDDVFCRGYRRTELKGPLFIISQPRSGTTLLLRTLAADEATFFTLNHLDWRVPSVAAWSLIERLGMRKRLEQIDYWPDTELGRLASKMHFHNLGSIESHGVFFEESFYHHYFTFRRFPFRPVLDRIAEVDRLSDREKAKLVGSLRKVVQKAAHHRGRGRIWLTKENENADLYRLVRRAFPGARFLAITRDPQRSVRSYISASDASTQAKHGIDPGKIPGWYDANMRFRQEQCLKQIAFCRELEADGAIAYVDYDRLVADIPGTIKAVYAELGLAMTPAFDKHLAGLAEKQKARVAGYQNTTETIAGFEDYARFVESVRPAASPAASARRQAAGEAVD
jgi:hypothetical protein